MNAMSNICAERDIRRNHKSTPYHFSDCILADPAFLAIIRFEPIESLLVPLLELHEKQHRAMLSRLTILASLTMCSQVATDFRVSLDDPNSVQQ